MENADKDVVLECRIAKIELEHEVLLREMEVALVGMVGLPVTAVTLILQFVLYQNPAIMVLSLLALATGLVLLEDYRSERKDKLTKKQQELDALANELTVKRTATP